MDAVWYSENLHDVAGRINGYVTSCRHCFDDVGVSGDPDDKQTTD